MGKGSKTDDVILCSVLRLLHYEGGFIGLIKLFTCFIVNFKIISRRKQKKKKRLRGVGVSSGGRGKLFPVIFLQSIAAAIVLIGKCTLTFDELLIVPSANLIM